MSKKETAAKFLSKINTLDFQGAAPYCTDDFTYSGPFPKPLSFDEWKESAEPFLKAFPDWNYNAKFESEDGDFVHITVHVTATHSGDLDLTSMGMGVVPASGRSVAMPDTKGRLIFKGDKIANLDFEIVEGAGIPGILAQIGASSPNE
jgi:hypothetical protein